MFFYGLFFVCKKNGSIKWLGMLKIMWCDVLWWSLDNFIGFEFNLGFFSLNRNLLWFFGLVGGCIDNFNLLVVFMFMKNCIFG